MNDLLATLSSHGNESISAEAPSESESSVQDKFSIALHELEGIDECLHNLAEARQKSMALHTAEASRDWKDTIERNIHLILQKSRSVQAVLDRDLAPGQHLREPLAISLRKSLKDRMNLLEELRANIEADYREVVRRHFYIVSGQNPSAEALDRITEGGQGHNFLRQAIADPQEAIESVLDLEKRQEGIRYLQCDLEELQQIFAAMAALVLDQGDAMDDIEKNIEDSASALNAGVQQLGGAKKNAGEASKWVWWTAVLVLILILIAVVAVVLFVVNLGRRGTFVPLGFAVSSIW